MLQVGMVMRVGAAFGRTPTGGINREIISTVVSSLGLRYLAASLIKLVPILGWIVGGMISMASTMLIGEIAIRYFEARGQLIMPRLNKRHQVTQIFRNRFGVNASKTGVHFMSNIMHPGAAAHEHLAN